MWTLEPKDFEVIKSWGLDKNPFAAADEYSARKEELRWLNPEHRELFVEYINKRLAYIAGKNFDDYYKRAEKPIDKERWTFLKDRKAWYIMPLGWENFTKKDCRIADFGCGDGDSVQRIIDFVDETWKRSGVTGRKVEIIGVDLNKSRIENAKKLVTSSNPNIKFEFHVGDICGEGLKYGNGEFDYSMANGVFEILEDKPCERFIAEMCRTTKSGVFVEDLFERFPGGYPRDHLHEMFAKHGFRLGKRHVILSEPFDVDKVCDPKKLWPVMKIQNLWLEKN